MAILSGLNRQRLAGAPSGGGGFTDTTINNEAQMFATISADYGATVRPNVQVSAGVSKAASAASGVDFGDYIGLAFQSGKFFPLWADNSGAVAGNPNLPKLDQLTVPVTVTIALPCPADISPAGGDHLVNINDLLAVINAWGNCPIPCPPYCTADINHDCTVNVNDLLVVINAWGPCP